MSDKSSSFGLPYLDRSSMQASEVTDTSTPINSHQTGDHTNLSPIEIDDHLIKKKDTLHIRSILKNSPNRPYSANIGGGKNFNGDFIGKDLYDNSFTTSFQNAPQPNTSYYSIAGEKKGMASQLTPAEPRVFFSPTKEVVTYGGSNEAEYTVDLTQESEPLKASGQSQGSLNRILTDPTIPYVLLLYLQLALNLAVVGVVLYLLYSFISTIQQDIQNKMDLYTTIAKQEISACSKKYFLNKCSNENGNVRAPALEQECSHWEICMNRDPMQIGRSKVSAETLAEIVNEFLRPISWKSLIMISAFIVGSIVVTNVAFGSYRSASKFEAQADRKRIAELEEKLRRQEKTSSNAQTQMVTPNNYIRSRPIANDSLVSYSSPLYSKARRDN